MMRTYRKRRKKSNVNTDELVKNFFAKGGKTTVLPAKFGVDRKLDQQLADFYKSEEWKNIRVRVFASKKRECAYCGSRDKLQVDHIKPLRFNWDLRVDLANLQILCEKCNFAKGSNIDYNYHLKLSGEDKMMQGNKKMKRIGFIVSSQTLVPHGGIGQYTKSFIDLMTSHGYYVDIITDKNPPNVSDEFIKEINARIIYPDNLYRYTDHSAIFMYEDSYCYERMANFRNSIIKALSSNIYDIFICNTYESVQVVSTLGLSDYIQTIAYTHLESQIFKHTKNPFLDSVNEMMLKQLAMSNLYIGTQSKYNQLQHDTAYHLPIPLPEKELLKEYHRPREGVLFIGRWEEGKNPELYLDLIEKTKLPARVMTNANGAKKFEERLKKLGVDYKIAVSVIGREKVDFITSCRVAFNPSTVESYGIAFYEQMIQLPTIALEKQRWTNNFNEKYFYTTNKKNMVKDITEIYNLFDTAQKYYERGSLAHTIANENEIFHMYNQCFNDFTVKKSNNATAKICSETTVRYKDYVDSLGRNIICIDDVKSVLSNKHKFRVIYTKDDTYLTKDPMFEPSSDINQSLDFFELSNG